MAIGWSTQQDISIAQVRELIGYKIADGSTSFEELLCALNYFGVSASIKKINSLQGLISHGVCIIDLEAKGISNRKYDYEGNHYVLITGVEGDYFVVQDPLSGPDQLYDQQEVWDSTAYLFVITVQKLRR